MLKKFCNHLRSQQEITPVMAMSIAAITLTIVILFTLTNAYKYLEFTLYDLRFKIKPSIPQWEELVFIDMDDMSVKNIGKYPWPRTVYAQVLETMDDVGIRQVAFDVEFPDNSPKQVNDQYYNELISNDRSKIDNNGIKNLIINNDKIFAESISNSGKVVLAYSLNPAQLDQMDGTIEEKAAVLRDKTNFIEKVSLPIKDKYNLDFKELHSASLENIKDILYPRPDFYRNAITAGYVNSSFDIDGINRKVAIIQEFDNRLYMHLSLAMLTDICKISNNDIVINPGKNVILKNALHPIKQTRSDIVIPINDRGEILINWASGKFARTFTHIPLYALLEYPKLKNYVHDYWNEQDAQNNGTLHNYGNRLDSIEAELSTNDRPDERIKLIKESKKIRKDIADVQNSYLSVLLKQGDELKKKIKESGNTDTVSIEELNNIQNFLAAAEVVQSVESINGKFCIIGLTATATSDFGPIPVDSEYPMVGTYHNVVNTVIQESFITKVPFLINIIFFLIIGFGISLAAEGLSAKKSIITMTVALLFINIVNIMLFAFMDIWFDELGSNLALIFPSVAITAYKFIKEEGQKRFIKSAFSHYLSPKVIEQIIEHPDSLQLGGGERHITTFFSDVAGFSSISEKLSPTELVQLLNDYLSEMTDIVMKYDGTVDKFEGDAIMAFFGAPQTLPDHPIKACHATIEMQKRLIEMREKWRSEGKNELKVRIGLNTGKAVVGNMGSRTRMDYTVMGDSVNLASRLEGANKFYGTYSMISEFTYEIVKDEVECRELDKIRVIGKEEPIRVFELIDLKGQMDSQMTQIVSLYNRGLELFKSRDWTGALEKFKEATAIKADDGPSLTYIERCTEFMKEPPSAKWDGVYRLKSK